MQSIAFHKFWRVKSGGRSIHLSRLSWQICRPVREFFFTFFFFFSLFLLKFIHPLSFSGLTMKEQNAQQIKKWRAKKKISWKCFIWLWSTWKQKNDKEKKNHYKRVIFIRLTFGFLSLQSPATRSKNNWMSDCGFCARTLRFRWVRVCSNLIK